MTDLKPVVRYTRVQTPTDPGPGRTKQEFKKDTDMNLIVSRYRKTGVLPQGVMQGAKRYGDFSQIPDFTEMCARVDAARSMFLALPSKVRRALDHDPENLLKAVQSKEGVEFLIANGLGRRHAEQIAASSPGSGAASSNSEDIVKTEGSPSKTAPVPTK